MGDRQPPRAPADPAWSVLADELSALRASYDSLRDQNEALIEAQIVLEQSRDDYAELYDAAPLPMLTVGRGGLVVTANLAASALYELEGTRLVNSLFRSFVHQLDRLIVTDVLKAAPGALQPRELRLLLAAGTEVPVQVWARHSSRKDGVIHLTLIDLRNGEREREKEELIASERRARQASDSKDEFIAMLSHELRTPLTPILAAASRWALSPEIGQDVRRVFEMIRRNAAAEARLVDDLLDATGILRGKTRVVRKPIDVHAVLQECHDSFTPAATAKAIKLSYAPEADRATVSGDPLRLRQVFSNLLKNALKFTAAGGEVTLRTWNSGSNIAVEVSDTGIGFDVAQAPRLFDAFDQLDREQSARGGLGLGLAISKGLVELHEGRISGMSPGRDLGARFVVELPTAADQEIRSTPRAAVVRSAHSATLRLRRILLVEDHEDTAEILQMILEEHGYSVLRAGSVGAALAIDLTSVDVLISDLGLPDGSGIDILRQLEGRFCPPAIALSGYAMESDIRATKQAGFAVHLTKPVDFEALLSSVRELADAAEFAQSSQPL